MNPKGGDCVAGKAMGNGSPEHRIQEKGVYSTGRLSIICPKLSSSNKGRFRLYIGLYFRYYTWKNLGFTVLGLTHESVPVYSFRTHMWKGFGLQFQELHIKGFRFTVLGLACEKVSSLILF